MVAAGVRAEQPLAASTIVIYNRDVLESVELAKFYAQKRGIERNHLVGLSCSKEEEISREEYDANIAGPLREIFAQRKWWTLREKQEGGVEVSDSSIHFVALIKGMPLKIRATTTAYPGDEPASLRSPQSLVPLFLDLITGARRCDGPIIDAQSDDESIRN